MVEPLFRSERPRLPAPQLAFVVTLNSIGLLFLNASYRLNAQENDKDSPSHHASADKSKLQTFRWRVVTFTNGDPITGAKVEIKRDVTLDQEFRAIRTLSLEQHTTDADGYYSFDLNLTEPDASNQSLKIEISHANYLPRQLIPIPTTRLLKNYQADKPIGVETVRLHLAREVHGILQTPDGKPAAHVDIIGFSYPGEHTAALGRTGEWRRSDITSTTDAQGHFRLRVATNGNGNFWFRPKAYAPKGIVAPEHTADLGVVTLETGVRPKGRVIDSDGNPVALMKVVARRMSRDPIFGLERRYERWATTDTNGRFQLDPIDAGVYDFQAFHDLTSDNVPPFYAGVFVPVQQTISADGDEVEIQGVPAAEIRVTTLNSKRELSDAIHINVSGKMERMQFGAQSLHPTKGRSIVKIPKGLSQVRMVLLSELDDEALLMRRKPGASYESNLRGVLFESMDRNADIEIIRFLPTRLRVKTVDSNGKEYPDTRPEGTITSSDLADGQVDVEFHKREGGVWRSQPLIANGILTVTVRSALAGKATKTITMVEGEEQEVTVVLKAE